MKRASGIQHQVEADDRARPVRFADLAVEDREDQEFRERFVKLRGMQGLSQAARRPDRAPRDCGMSRPTADGILFPSSSRPRNSPAVRCRGPARFRERTHRRSATAAAASCACTTRRRPAPPINPAIEDAARLQRIQREDLAGILAISRVHDDHHHLGAQDGRRARSRFPDW